MEPAFNQHKLYGTLLLSIAFFIHFSNLGGLSIYALDEAKNATAALEMWQNQEWIVPTFNGEYRFDKPPLHYYSFIIAYKLFGINEFAARFFPALFGFLCTWISYHFVKKNLGYQVACISLLVLSSSLHWYIQFHMAVPDPFLIFFMVSGMMLFFEWSKSGFRSIGHMMGTYTCFALAVLSKGPIGVFLPCMALLAYSLLMQQLNGKRLKRIFHPVGLALFLLIALPWYILVALETKGLWLEEFFFKHNIGRFSSPMEGHGGGFWKTCFFVFAGMLPFAFFLPQSILHTLKYRTNKGTTFALVCSGTIILFFMLAGTKLPNYTLPSYPFLALIIGNYLYQVLQKGQIKSMLVPGTLLSLLILTLPFGIYFGLSTEAGLEVPNIMPWLFMISYLTIPIIVLAYRKSNISSMIYAMAASFMLVSLVFFWLAFPIIDRQSPIGKAPIAEIKTENLYYFNNYNPAFLFYVQKPLVDLRSLDDPNAASGYLITRLQYLPELDQLGLNYELVYSKKDLFESPTSIILKLLPDSIN
ncbi:glycosyltransferase family 39 protein [Echinicola marina]|uniref:ArnT family glycosyltransferase n=1 Tax=Echinicola marina TaxID=2859768 RepID=UPI001CF675EF|nr:glycosyltransferase family 39 protein [Echinicola marina]UCS94278.1 glycosyltransferase family 39 protein [Echinicola marina]